MNILFLDIDGVLNSFDGGCRIHYDKALRLNRILTSVDPHIVISSSWRYQVHMGSMTLKGFENMLRSHGIMCHDRVIGVTRKDAESRDGFPTHERPEQISDWLDVRCPLPVDKILVLDDSTEPFEKFGLPVYRTRSVTGLTDEDVPKAIAAFRRRGS